MTPGENEKLAKRLEQCIADLRSGKWSVASWVDRAEGQPAAITMGSLVDVPAPKAVKREFEFCLIRNTEGKE